MLTCHRFINAKAKIRSVTECWELSSASLLPSPISHLPSPVSCLLSLVPRLPSSVSYLPRISCLPSPVSLLLNPISRFPFLRGGDVPLVAPSLCLPSPVFSLLPFPVLQFSSSPVLLFSCSPVLPISSCVSFDCDHMKFSVAKPSFLLEPEPPRAELFYWSRSRTFESAVAPLFLDLKQFSHF